MKKTYYKFYVKALDKKGKILAKSKVCHVVTKGGKYGNFSSVTVKPAKAVIKKGKSIKLKAKAKRQKNKKVKVHRRVCYESSNTKVAKVTSKGKVKGVGQGTARIYVYTQNGVYKTVKIIVK